MDELPMNDYKNNGESSTPNVPQRGILRRSKTDASERPSQLNVNADPRSVGWSSATMPRNSDITTEFTNHQEENEEPAGDWKQTLHRKKRMNILPHTHSSADDIDSLVNEITKAMEGDEKFMADDVDGEIMRREAFKELTEPLAARKEIKRRLTMSSSKRKTSSKMSCWQAFKYMISMKLLKSKESFKATLHDYMLWNRELKEIEGIFGTGVGTYFRFLRYLLILNFFIVLLVCSFILTPQLVLRYGNTDYTNSTLSNPSNYNYEDNSYSIVTKYASPMFPEEGVITADDLRDSNSSTTDEGVPFRGLDWLTGAGWLLSSELYYGSYSPVNICMNAECNSTYSMPLAYLLTIIACFVFLMIIIPARVTELYKENTLNNADEMGSFLVSRIFSAWDFGISDKKAAIIKHSSISNELSALCAEVEDSDLLESRWTILRKYLVRGVWWAIITGVTLLISWAVYLLLDEGLDMIFKEKGDDYWSTSLYLLAMPLIVTAILVVLPFLLEKQVKYESYKTPRTEVWVTLARTTFLEVLVLGVVVGFWFSNGPGYIDSDAERDVLQTNVTCWESALGAEIYRLMVVDFVVQILGSLFVVIVSLCSSERRTNSTWNSLLKMGTLSRNLGIKKDAVADVSSNVITRNSFHGSDVTDGVNHGGEVVDGVNHGGEVVDGVNHGGEVADGVNHGGDVHQETDGEVRRRARVIHFADDIIKGREEEEEQDKEESESNWCYDWVCDFSVIHNTFHLVYNQTLLWAGLFFAPLLSVVCLIKLLCLFYIQKSQIVYFHKPTSRPWRAVHTETVFFSLILVSVVVAVIGAGFVLIRGCSSSSCGPLAGNCPFVSVLSFSNDSHQTVFMIILEWLTKPAVVAAIIVVLVIGVYWARSIAYGRSELVAVLREQLELEIKDRAFLLSLATKIRADTSCIGVLSSPSAHSNMTAGHSTTSFDFSSPHRDSVAASDVSVTVQVEADDNTPTSSRSLLSTNSNNGSNAD